ncbi:MAG: prepilin-type N-terminal cleavage/methylation domain-containing protein [Candidatus Daviesbacteria bacterium]|nr:prepilin-type N-terminal cleavage/methylation domain-containing protein [Candidatus Daviesbacteria bacterium]
MTNKGFTLAEILVVMAIVAIVGLIMVVIFTNTLRGSNKSQILSIMKQNGQAVLDSIDRVIRNSDGVACPVSGSSDTIVIVKNGTYSRYRVVSANSTPGSAPAVCIGTGKNGCIILDNPTPSPSEITPQLFFNRICGSIDPMSSAQILTDTNSLTGVSIDSGLFTVSKPSGFKAVVTVNFTLGPGVDVPQIVRNQIGSVINRTTIELR